MSEKTGTNQIFKFKDMRLNVKNQSIKKFNKIF